MIWGNIAQFVTRWLVLLGRRTRCSSYLPLVVLNGWSNSKRSQRKPDLMINAAIVGLGRWGRRLVDSVQKSGSPLGSKIKFSHAVVRTVESAQEYAGDQHLTVTSSIDNIFLTN